MNLTLSFFKITLILILLFNVSSAIGTEDASESSDNKKQPTLRIPMELLHLVMQQTDSESLSILVQSDNIDLSESSKLEIEKRIDKYLIEYSTHKDGYDLFATKKPYKYGLLRFYNGKTVPYHNFKTKLSENQLEKISEAFTKTTPKIAGTISSRVMFPVQVLYHVCMKKNWLNEPIPEWVLFLGISYYDPKMKIPQENAFDVHDHLVRACLNIYNEIEFTTPFELNMAFRVASSYLSGIYNKKEKLTDKEDRIALRLVDNLFSMSNSPLISEAFQDSKNVKTYIFQEHLCKNPINMLKLFGKDEDLLKVKPFHLLPNKFIFKYGIKLYQQAKLKFTFEDLWRMILKTSKCEEFIQKVKNDHPEMWAVENHEIDFLIQYAEGKLHGQTLKTPFLTGLKT